MGAASSINCFEERSYFSPNEVNGMMFICRSEASTEMHALCDYEERMCKVMIADEPGRILFAKYIKLGTWMRKFRASPEYGVIMMLASQVQSEVKVGPEFPTTLVNFESDYNSPATDFETAKNSPSSSGGTPTSRQTVVRVTSNTSSIGTMSRENSTGSNRSSISTIGGSGYSQMRDDIIKDSFTMKELLSILFVALYPFFLDSTMHKQSQRSGLKKMISTKANSNNEVDSSDFYSNSDDENSKEGNGHALNLLLKAATYHDEQTLISILAAPHWMINHLPSNMIDLAPVSISIASADGMRGFPLVYVNKAFEKLTGFTMKEVSGKNCKVLQGTESNHAQIQRMREALEEQRAVKVELINYTKNGRKFKNLVVLTPAFDRMGIFSYVIGIQFDITEYKLTTKDVQLMEDILSILPYILNR